MALLPGVNTLIKDRFYSLSRTDIPTGPRVLLIGKRTTADGTSDGSGMNQGNDAVANLDPYRAVREDWVINAFGEGSQLHRGYLELVSGGAQSIYVIALPADTTYNHTAGTIASASFTAANAGANLFDEVFSAAETAQPDIIVPWGRGGGPTDWEVPATPGNDEVGFHADNSATVANSWAKKISDKVAEITANSNPCFAILGVKPFTTSENMTPLNTSGHLAFNGLVARDAIGFDNGIYLIVVGTELKPLGYPDEFGFSNGAAFLAGELAGRDSWSSPTGKNIFNIERLRYVPTNVQQQNLIDKAVVPLGIDYLRNPTWIDTMTYSKATSDYTRVTTLRIVFDALQMVRQVTQKFIGEASTIAARNAIETAITAGLRGMQQLGALLTSDFQVTYIPSENKAIIDLILNPAFELRNIEVSVSVQI